MTPLDINDSLIVDMDNVEMVSGVAEFPIGGQSGECAVRMVNVHFTGMFNGAPGTYTCVSMCNPSQQI